MAKYKEEDLNLLMHFNNEERELLKCPHCGEILTQLEVTRDVRRFERYALNTECIDYDDLEDVEDLEGSDIIVECSNCHHELTDDHINQLMDCDLLII
jgi:hypothetical protein